MSVRGSKTHTPGSSQPYRRADNLVGVQRPFHDLGFARVDTDREARQGAPEGIMAEGKTPEEIRAIATALLDGGASSVLVTRADAEARAALLEARRTGSRTSARGSPGWRATCPRCAGS